MGICKIKPLVLQDGESADFIWVEPVTVSPYGILENWFYCRGMESSTSTLYFKGTQTGTDMHTYPPSHPPTCTFTHSHIQTHSIEHLWLLCALFIILFLTFSRWCLAGREMYWCVSMRTAVCQWECDGKPTPSPHRHLKACLLYTSDAADES